MTGFVLGYVTYLVWLCAYGDHRRGVRPWQRVREWNLDPEVWW